MLTRVIAILLLVGSLRAQNPSPCPDVFTYEPRDPKQGDRWYGVVLLKTAEELSGVWLHVTLDRPADLLGNWFGESVSSDNMDYTIKNRQYKLSPGPPISVRFFIKYNTASSIPSLVGLRLNGKTICPTAEAPSSADAQLHISRPRNESNRPTQSQQTQSLQPTQSQQTQSVRPTQNQQTQSVRPTQNQLNNRNDQQTPSWVQTTASNDDEFFAGDFSLSRRPVLFQTTKRPRPGRNDNCGTVVMRPRPLVTHGEKTSEGEWPWHAALYHSKGVDLTYTCGASLIAPNYIITAAHCVTKPQTSRANNPENLLVYLGKHNLRKFGAGVQDIQVSKITVHPDYNASNFRNDVAVLKLLHSAEITDYVRTVCLWDDNAELSNVVDRLGTVVGWGFDENGRLTENLMQAKMPVVSSEKCVYSNPDFFSRFSSDTSYCAGFRNGTSACNGDSGGGMVFPRSTSPNQWQLRGLVSISVALQDQFVCDTNHYVVFSDLAKHLDWIRSTISA